MIAPIEAAIEASGACMVRATFNDEWAVPRGDYGSGHYWGLRVKTAEGQLWKIDLWGWDDATYARKLEDHRALQAALEACDRDLILRLKAEAMQLAEFRRAVTSWDVYRFVLAGGGTTLEELLSAMQRT